MDLLSCAGKVWHMNMNVSALSDSIEATDALLEQVRMSR